INFFSDHSRDVMQWKFTKDGKIVWLRPVGSMRVDNSDILLSCGLAGLGIIQAPFNAPAPHIASGALEESLTQYPSGAKREAVLHPYRHYLSPKLGVFMHWISEVLILGHG
ncbi:LysR family transcriptional regulator, partial [Klebsiella pneumoniae]